MGVWTIPEVGFFGLTRAAAEQAGRTVKEGVAGYDMCLRGRVFAPDGLLKLVFDVESREILGVHITGRDACELVPTRVRRRPPRAPSRPPNAFAHRPPRLRYTTAWTWS